jgi:hypothetical protein
VDVSDERPTDQEAALIAEAKKLGEEIKTLLPLLISARKNWLRSRNETDGQTLEAIQAQADTLVARHKFVIEETQRLSGVPEEVLQALEKAQIRGDSDDRIFRDDLAANRVDPTDDIDRFLPTALEGILRVVDPSWLQSDIGEQHRLPEITTGEPLSLVKGIRRRSAFPEIHRFIQTVRVATDYLNQHPTYDHFAGALLVPQLTCLGSKLTVLRHVRGAAERIEALWKGPSPESDSVAYELLVAAACAERGREIEFIAPTIDKSPDLRSHDPYPLVIECKRKRVLSDYEIEEEAVMNRLFRVLDAGARSRGVWGRFTLALAVEAKTAPVGDVVASLLRQRLAAHPERSITYAWGSVSYEELPSRLILPGQTRAYGPNMLSFAFGWNSDLPEWDGLVCRVDCKGAAWINEVYQPVALLWSNKSQQATKKRSWSPVDAFGDATSQIPPGEDGIIYVAYQEGTRAPIADLRTENFLDRVREWSHSASIRIPIAFLTRLYPRALNHGNPDLIESSVRLYTENGELLFEDFPTRVFDGPRREKWGPRRN